MKLGGHCVLYGAEIASNTDAVLSRLAFAGAEGCELGERFFGVEDRQKLTAALGRNGIKLAGMHCNNLKLMDLLQNPERSEQALRRVAQFLAPLPNRNIIATGGPDDPSAPGLGLHGRTLAQGAIPEALHDPQNARIIARNLNDIAGRIKAEFDVQVNYHNHSWEFADGGLLWFALAEYAPQVRFALDTGWAAVSGFDPVELMDRYPGRFHYVHLRDYIRSDNPGDRMFEEVHRGFVDLGTGDMDYPRLMRKLTQELFEEDWAIVEYEIGNFDQNSYLRAISYLRGARDMLRAEV